jgi:hypothetical protein
VTDNYLKSNIGQVKLATAVLIASVVQTLNESDPTFRKRFEEHLAEWYAAMRDSGKGDAVGLELLVWAREAARKSAYEVMDTAAVLAFKKL